MSAKGGLHPSLDDCRHSFDSLGYVDCFIKNGFVVAEAVFDKKLIESIYKFISTHYLEYKAKLIKKFPERDLPVLGMSKYIFSELKSEGLFEKLIGSTHFLNATEKLLGPDLAMVDSVSIWINDQDDSSIVMDKSLHQEIWSGIGVDDLTVWIPLHETMPESTMNVIPGSHYFGFFPNRNRNIVCPDDFEMPDSLALAPLQPGCAVFFHSLLLHETSGKAENIRYSMSLPVKNTLSPTTRQQQTFGYIALKNGPLSKIRTILGNDYLSPFRTYGGAISNHPSFNPSDLE